MQRIDERSLVAATKPELVLLDTPELNAETPAHLLDDDITPIARLFARNTGAMPAFSDAEIAGWTLRIDGFVRVPRSWTIAELKREFATVTETAVIECAGNGRAFFPDPAGTVLWRHGAVGCVRWTGVRLGDLLRKCELLPQAVYTGHHSPDVYLDGSGPAISRGLPIGQGAGAGNARGIRAQRRAAPRAAWRPAAAGRAGLSRRVVPEVADADRGARPRARRRADARRPLPDAARAAALWRAVRCHAVRDHHRHAGEVADHRAARRIFRRRRTRRCTFAATPGAGRRRSRRSSCRSTAAGHGAGRASRLPAIVSPGGVSSSRSAIRRAARSRSWRAPPT